MTRRESTREPYPRVWNARSQVEYYAAPRKYSHNVGCSLFDSPRVLAMAHPCWSLSTYRMYRWGERFFFFFFFYFNLMWWNIQPTAACCSVWAELIDSQHKYCLNNVVQFKTDACENIECRFRFARIFGTGTGNHNIAIALPFVMPMWIHVWWFSFSLKLRYQIHI